ncbi:MAG: ATP-binding protein, partial [Bacteroidia bacterium]|nr:ATP-binding protein [Bacteroidia bacterium]
IETTHGTALLIQQVRCTLKNCFARIAGCRYGILVQQGDLDLFSMTSEIAAEIGISAAGSFSGEKTDLFINGEETGLLVKGSTCIASSGNFGISGNTAITIDNDCIFTDMQITATGDRAGLVVGGKFTNDNTCISIRGEEGVNIGKDMIFSGHSLEMRGDTGLVVGGALIVTKGSITAVNDKNGIEIHGAYVQESGMVLGTGMSGNGIVVTRNIKISGGKLDAVGNLNGLSALGDFDILGGIITISGKCGLFVDGTLNGMGGYLTAFGDECGLYVSGGSAIFNGLSADIAGDIAVYVGDAMTAGKGALQISGHYCGILVDGGDLSFRNGIHDITADTYGMLLKKGSVHAESGRIHVTATGEDNNTSGICLESGDLIIDGALMTISGGADGVRVEAGDVKIMKGKLNTEGTVNGVVARGVCLGNGILTAYGTKDQALSLEQQKLISEKDTTIATEKNSIMTEKGNYNNQKYIHVYPDHYENITVPAEVSSLEKILPWMEGQLRQNGVPEIYIPKMHLVTEELFVNIANYAYPETKGSAEITMYLGPCLRLIFTDTGIPFDPLQVAEPDFTLPIEDRKTGGRGIFLSRKLTDEITYQRIDNRNVLTVYKQIYV